MGVVHSVGTVISILCWLSCSEWFNTDLTVLQSVTSLDGHREVFVRVW